jgi:hypothetical protein
VARGKRQDARADPTKGENKKATLILQEEREIKMRGRKELQYCNS